MSQIKEIFATTNNETTAIEKEINRITLGNGTNQFKNNEMKTLHLKTNDFSFLVDIEESDENAAVEMYDNENKLVSDNSFASGYLWEILAGLTDEKIIFISDELEYNRKEVLKEFAEENNL